MTDEDEYFPPPRELRELVPALDALGAFAFGGDPQAARERGGPFSDDRGVDASTRAGRARSLSAAAGGVVRHAGERLGVVEARLQPTAELLGQRRDLRPRATPPGAARRAAAIGSPTTIATRAERGSDLPDARIRSLPPMPTGKIGTPSLGAMYATPSKQVDDLATGAARALREHRRAALRLRARPAPP